MVEDIDVGFGRQEFDHKLKLAKVEKKSDQESQDDRDVRSIHCNLSAPAARSEVSLLSAHLLNISERALIIQILRIIHKSITDLLHQMRLV